MLDIQYQIANLISRYLAGTITTDETIELEKWRNLSPENDSLFRKITTEEKLATYLQEGTLFPSEKGWIKLEKEIGYRKTSKLSVGLVKYAAVFLILLAIGATFLLLQKESIADVAQSVVVEDILPGGNRAVLTLAGGEVIDLESLSASILKEKDGTSIAVDSATLNYQSVQENIALAEPVYNRIDIPRGGEYQLILSDGTKVYLNSLSSLYFPVQFVGNKRVVRLDGEAYFEVAQHEEPFIVEIGEMQVEVLGTTFNISAYEGEEYQTTLVSGSVKVMASSGNSRILKPSEQAGFYPGSDNFDVRMVDTSLYTSWTSGRISFRNRSLEDIMNTLSRWYDVEVEYKDPAVKNIRFGCHVNRYETIRPFLELLELTGNVRVTVENKTIIVQLNRN